MSTNSMQEVVLGRRPKKSVASVYGGLLVWFMSGLLHTLSQLILMAEQFLVTHADTGAQQVE